MRNYPEHKKIEQINDQYTAIETFLEETDYTLGVWKDERFRPATKSNREILNEYFGIDAVKLEAERRQLIEDMKGLGQ